MTPPTRPIDWHRIEGSDDAAAAMYRTMTPGQRIAAIARAYRTARALVAAGVRYHHPEMSPEQVSQEVRRRMAGGTR